MLSKFIFKKISDWNADHLFGGERTQKSPRGEGCGGYFLFESKYNWVNKIHI